MTIGVALVGCGHWGQNLLRTFSRCEAFDLVAACDRDETALARARQDYRLISTSQDSRQMLEDARVNAVAIATFPISTHFAVARDALDRGKHVLVEKPLAETPEHALELAELAETRGVTLMVDHTFLYNSAIQIMKEQIVSGEVGELRSYDSFRFSPRLIPSHTSVLWDLGPHDLSILDYLCGSEIVSVSAAGVRHLSRLGEDTAYLTIRYQSGLNARFLLSALADIKARLLLLGGSRKTVVFDDSQAIEKIRTCSADTPVGYDSGTRSYEIAGGWTAPRLDCVEPLERVVCEFASAILEGRPALSEGYSGYRVVRLLAAAQQSLDCSGREIELPPLKRKLSARTLSPAARAATST